MDFLKNRGAKDASSYVNNLMSKHLGKVKPVTESFLDLTKAFV